MKINFNPSIPPITPQAMQNIGCKRVLPTLDPRSYVTGGSTDCLGQIWLRIMQIFKKCLSWFSKPLTLEQRENRLITSERDIHSRLARQKRYAMHQMASEPVKPFHYSPAPDAWHKHEEIVGGLHVGISHFQGRRPTMEDEHLAVAFNLNVGGKDYPIQLFGIFDGHGGPNASRFVRDHLVEKLKETLKEYNPRKITEAGVWKALKMACVRLNRDYRTLRHTDGTTATVALILDNYLYAANVGDSRTILDNAGTPMQLTEDAKPNDARYRKGIEHRGGRVLQCDVPRVNGILAVARSIGDHLLHGAISARPKITVTPRREIRAGSHLILCCDGITDVARSVDLVNAAHMHRDLSPGDLARNFTYSAYHSGSTDNLSAMVVSL